MAYARRRFTSSRARKPIRRSRRPAGKRRSYRRSTRKRGMSTRTLLNKTSQKKRDNMLSFSNTTAEDPFSTDYTIGPAVMRRPVGADLPAEFIYVWNATGRPHELSTGFRGSKIDTSLRTNTTIFAVGLKERIKLETNNSAPWRWRRICFTSKNDYGEADPDESDYFRRTSNGMVRLLRAQSQAEEINDDVFDGQRNVDWLSAITAPINRRHVSVHYDRTRTIQSGNQSGVTRTYRQWHPMRKNVVYADEQAGEGMVDSGVSVTGKVGMGNYYVMDIFTKHGLNDDQSTLSYEPESTFFWHEK
ncbi:capsid protein [Black robin associated gemykibivirus 1]|uniref:Capsid protein n=1 Tax=Black robin associated gemykibivirus 1 TaxID=1391037 RepID=T1YTB1_9VIRU|nr:capsid protein [Black robin associated gemykibivirus 1]AGU67654.1 capsid protein [Black robin associated gemykibivirus 1]